MTSREKFEAWWGGPRVQGSFAERAFRNIAWDAWQASRDEEIELPPRQEPTSSGHYGEGYLVASSAGSALDYEDTVDAIRAAGFKVKGG
ncbi:hypothetical protein ABW09_12035 [Pluralibacter gergoviae]|nr:hypothetical protein ABW09_12035 [Pluralibacter gergoviae]